MTVTLACIAPRRLCYTAPMVLTREAILRELAAGRLEIDPFTDDQVGPASIAPHLGDEIRVMEASGDDVAVTDDADYRTITHLRRLDRPYVLRAGQTILCITRERLRPPAAAPRRAPAGPGLPAGVAHRARPAATHGWGS